MEMSQDKSVIGISKFISWSILLASGLSNTDGNTDNSMAGVKSSADRCSLVLTFHSFSGFWQNVTGEQTCRVLLCLYLLQHDAFRRESMDRGFILVGHDVFIEVTNILIYKTGKESW